MYKKIFMGVSAVSVAATAAAAIFININLAAEGNVPSTISLVNTEALAGEGGQGGTTYRWSNKIDCPGLGNGDYHVCQVDGYQNVCTNPGGRTCNCGSSQSWNNDGNCD